MVVSPSCKLMLPQDFSASPILEYLIPRLLNKLVETDIWPWIRQSFEDVLYLSNFQTMAIITNVRWLKWVNQKRRFLIFTTKVIVVLHWLDSCWPKITSYKRMLLRQGYYAKKYCQGCQDNPPIDLLSMLHCGLIMDFGNKWVNDMGPNGKKHFYLNLWMTTSVAWLASRKRRIELCHSIKDETSKSIGEFYR